MVQVVPPSKPFAISAANHEAARTDQASHSSLRGEGNEFLSRSLSAVGLPVGRVADADGFWGEGGGRGGVPDTVPRIKQASLQKADWPLWQQEKNPVPKFNQSFVCAEKARSSLNVD